MTAITVGQATATVREAPSATRPSVLTRAWEAFVSSRMRQVEQEIAMHSHLLPAQLEEVGDRLARSEKDLPFRR